MSAKRQRTMREMLLREKKLEVGMVEIGTSSQSTSSKFPTELSKAKLWKDSWYGQFDWIQFNSELGKVFCKLCTSKGGKSVYGKGKSCNIKVSTFQDHQNSKEYKTLAGQLNKVRKLWKNT